MIQLLSNPTQYLPPFSAANASVATTVDHMTSHGCLPSIISLQEAMATSRAVSSASFCNVISAPASNN